MQHLQRARQIYSWINVFNNVSFPRFLSVYFHLVFEETFFVVANEIPHIPSCFVLAQKCTWSHASSSPVVLREILHSWWRRELETRLKYDWTCASISENSCVVSEAGLGLAAHFITSVRPLLVAFTPTLPRPGHSATPPPFPPCFCHSAWQEWAARHPACPYLAASGSAALPGRGSCRGRCGWRILVVECRTRHSKTQNLHIQRSLPTCFRHRKHKHRSRIRGWHLKTNMDL